MGLGDRGVIGDKWSSRILWLCAIGSAIAVERQLQNREKMTAESLRAAESSADGGK